jgi:hypothetical protein
MTQIEIDACNALLRIASSLEKIVTMIEEERDGYDTGRESQESSQEVS